MKNLTPIIFLLSFFVLFILPLSAQNEKVIDSLFAEATLLRAQYEKEKSLAVFEELLPIVKKKGNDEILLKYYHELALLQNLRGDHDAFVQAGEKALSIIDENMNGVHPLKYELLDMITDLSAFTHRDITTTYLEKFRNYLDAHPDEKGEANYMRRTAVEEALQGKLHIAADIYEQSLKMGGFYSTKNESEAYINLAFFYEHTDRLGKSFSYRLKAIQVLENEEVPDHINLGKIYNALAQAGKALNRRGFSQAIEYAKKAQAHGLSSDDSELVMHSLLTQVTNNLELYIRFGDAAKLKTAWAITDELTTYYDQTIAKGETMFFPYGPGAYNLWTDFYIKEKDAEKAREYLEKAKKYAERTKNQVQTDFNSDHYDWRLSQIYLIEKNYESALRHMQKSVCLYIGDWGGCDDYDKLPYLSFSEKPMDEYARVKMDAYTHLFHQTGDEKYLLKTFEVLSFYDSIAVQKEHGLMTLRVHRPYADYGVVANAEYYFLNKNEDVLFQALINAEKQKSHVFLKQLSQADTYRNSNMPDSVKTKLGKLKEEFDFLKNTADAKVAANADDAQGAITEKDKKKKEYLDYLEFTKNEYSEENVFGNIMENLKLKELKSFSKNVKNETFIEFSLGEEYVYVIVLDPSGNDIVKLDLKKEELVEQIEMFRNILSENKNNYEAQAKKLYAHIFSPIKKLCTTDQLIIVPDAELAYLPFDLLMDENGQYLIENYSVRHAHSISWLQYENEKQRPQNNGEILAMASSPEMPTYAAISRDTVRDGLGHLPGAEQEISILEKYISGDFLSDKNSSESFFKNNAEKYGLIHLAMHAIIDEDVPSLSRLAFSQEENGEDAYLNSYEIYNLNLNADLVTLSACNSGFGEIKNGDGLQSLATAFAYAGCPNSVSSLWTVHDKSSAEIMDLFYRELLKNIPKHEALRNAKLAFLENKPESLKHPYYWGSFVYYGNGNPVTVIKGKKWGSGKWGTYMIYLSVALLSVLYFSKRKKK